MDILIDFKKRLQLYLHAMVQLRKMPPVLEKGILAFFSQTTSASELEKNITLFEQKFPLYKTPIDTMYEISLIDGARRILTIQILPAINDSNIDAMLDQVKKLMVVLNGHD